jgi:hypothetical protein
MTSVRTPRTGGADGAVPADRAAPSLDSASGLGAHLSAERDAFNGERIGCDPVEPAAAGSTGSNHQEVA